MQKSVGTNSKERYLIKLGEKSFLSLWSFPNVYFKPAKELSDLLVVCDKDVIIFQDKWSQFPVGQELSLGWKRWFERTVRDGAKQVWGAERRFKIAGTKLYLDSACTKPLPVLLPEVGEIRFHLIVVTHGASKKCQDVMGGSGSFMINTDIKSLSNHNFPFTIGDLDPNRTFVHVLDDTTLEIIMGTLDTVTDFTSYLSKKEKLLRSRMTIFSAGDEELLSNYLKHINDENEHDFDFEVNSPEELTAVAVGEGGWESFSKNPQRLEQIEQDKISYFWDDLIEAFSQNAIRGTQYTVPELNFSQGIESTEKVMRFMAKEPRFIRRVFSKSIRDMIEKTPETQRLIRVMSSHSKGLRYVILLFPVPKSGSTTHEEYRKNRAMYLQGVCSVVKMKYPETEHIVGIATESGLSTLRSEDAMYLDATQWTPQMDKEAKDFQDNFHILVNPKEVHITESEYPEGNPKSNLKNPRNKPCPCGSGKKYKKCHGA